jgi:hypothetical protein
VNLYRHTDPNTPFLWEGGDQPAGRWHAAGDGPVQYFATTPDGAWAEFLRHEEIHDVVDLRGLRGRAMWIVEHEEPELATPELPDATLIGGLGSYADCQREAQRLRQAGATGLESPSAAVEDGRASSHRVDDGPKVDHGDTRVVVLFGARPELRAQLCAVGRPSASILRWVRPL